MKRYLEFLCLKETNNNKFLIEEKKKLEKN